MSKKILYERDLIAIAGRENNSKRNYLVVNPLQAKHVPASPCEVLNLFSVFADKLLGRYDSDRILLVGFAETATAIGAHAAISLEAKYIHTTRESVPGAEYLYFSEEHSHASEQKLVKNDIDAVISEIDRVVFIEDELTTGNTVLNVISAIKEAYNKSISFTAASILNGMDEEHLELFAEKEIELIWLVKTDYSGFSDIAGQITGNGSVYECAPDENSLNTEYLIPELKIKGALNTRRAVDAARYSEACRRLYGEIIKSTGEIRHERVLVLGTEEFMYPALFTGYLLEKSGNYVRCHSTTRSPIIVSGESSYPLRCRYELASFYDGKRKTFIYDLDEYDRVIIITDAPGPSKEGIISLLNALKINNNDKNICIVRWCE